MICGWRRFTSEARVLGKIPYRGHSSEWTPTAFPVPFSLQHGARHKFPTMRFTHVATASSTVKPWAVSERIPHVFRSLPACTRDYGSVWKGMQSSLDSERRAEPGHVSLCARRAHLLVPCQCRSDRVSLSYCTDTPTYSFLLLQCSASAHFPLPLLSPHSGVGFQPAPSNIPIRRSTTYADVRVVFICTPCSYPAHLPDRTE